MWFNNKFNSNNTIHFDTNEWECTDPDEYQFCRKVNATTFEYIQLKDKSKVKDSRCIGKQTLALLNDETFISDWYEDEINVTEYDADQIGEYISPYGYAEMFDKFDESTKNQLIAECIFETDLIGGEYDE